MNNEQLHAELKALEKNEYICISSWGAGRKGFGLDGYFIDLNNNLIFKFSSSQTYNFTYENVDTNVNNYELVDDSAILNELGKFLYDDIKKLIDYVNNEQIFKTNYAGMSVLDGGTTVKIRTGSIDCKLDNLDRMHSGGKFDIYDKIYEIVKAIINTGLNTQEFK
jgi:hypothetical protein